jgi:signal peptidase complex subunit 2
MYDLILVYKEGKTGQTRESSFQKSVANFFDENGLMCMDLLEDAVLKLHKSLSSDKKDS